MYELTKLGEKSYCFNGPARIGLYLQDAQTAYLIDSGNDKDAGRNVLKVLKKNGWNLKGILNTHANADHIGGNRYLQNQTGCKIFTGEIENAFTEHPLLEPSFLYGGYPCRDLRHKFLMAEPSKTVGFDDEDFPREIEIIPLKGHFFNQAGFRIPDGTVFLADCVSSEAILKKYRFWFIYDVAAYLETLDRISDLEAAIFVPSHTETVTDICQLVELNRRSVMAIAGKILTLCRQPKNFERILQELFSEYRLTMNFEQYVLVGSTLRSYLSWLKDSGKMEVIFSDNLLLWQTL